MFGRDEGGSDFTFTQQQVDSLCALSPIEIVFARLCMTVLTSCFVRICRLTSWSNNLMGIGYGGLIGKPTVTSMQVLELCISDMTKPLLLANTTFIPYLINGLFLDPDHPRADLKDEITLWNQETHVECLAQLALFPPGRDALLQNPAVSEALVAVAQQGMSEQARDYAQAALMALSGDELQMRTEGQKHLMLSYQ